MSSLVNTTGLGAGLGLLGLGALNVPYAGPYNWVAVQRRFEQFHRNLFLTRDQFLDGMTKRGEVVACLDRHYYGGNSETDHSFFIGSWAKETAIRPPRDTDVYFLLPPAVHARFQGNAGNRQSALLQEVKAVLTRRYPNTDLRGDGQVVLVRFGSYSVEVVPAFELVGGGYWICDTHNEGSYKKTDPWAEVTHIDAVDRTNNGNLRPLIRMFKAWQAWCAVPIKSFHLELLAANFLAQSPWRLNSFFWFDWISRDFFAYLYHRANSYVVAPGTLESIYLGNEWQSRAESAYWRAVKACEYEERNLVEAGGEEWQKIFGPQIPRTV
jgi:hypothetical protein